MSQRTINNKELHLNLSNPHVVHLTEKLLTPAVSWLLQSSSGIFNFSCTEKQHPQLTSNAYIKALQSDLLVLLCFSGYEDTSNVNTLLLQNKYHVTTKQR